MYGGRGVLPNDVSTWSGHIYLAIVRWSHNVNSKVAFAFSENGTRQNCIVSNYAVVFNRSWETVFSVAAV